MSLGRIWSMLVPFACLGLQARAGDSDFQTWQQYTIPVYEKDGFKAQGYFETRWNEDSTHLKLVLISPQLDYAVLPYTRAGLNYTFIRSDAFDQEYQDQQRLETQVSNSFPLTKDLNLDARNRLEFRWIDGVEEVDKRLRSRIGLFYKLKGLGALTGIYANNEVFYDFVSGEFTENRLIPVGLSFSLNQNVTLDVFNMIQSVKDSGGWGQNYILGTHIRFKF